MSWGNKLMITFIVFAIMIGFMVYRCFAIRFDLVEPEYYKSEIKYQQVIDGTARARALGQEPQLRERSAQLELRMPPAFQHQAVKGTVLFYCAADARNDRTIDLQPDQEGVQQLKQIIPPGRYTVKINCNSNGTQYYWQLDKTIRP